MEVAFSHLETDCLDTPSCPASSSWDHPFFFLNSEILSANIIPSVLLAVRFNSFIIAEPARACYHVSLAICLEICQLPVAGADFHGKASKTTQTEYEVAEGKEGWYPFECRIKACAAGGVSWKRTERFNGDWMKKYYLKDCESAVW